MHVSLARQAVVGLQPREGRGEDAGEDQSQEVMVSVIGTVPQAKAEWSAPKRVSIGAGFTIQGTSLNTADRSVVRSWPL